MLREAAAALNLDLKHSLLIGDRLSDLQAGASAALAGVFHVLSGHGRKERESVLQWQLQASVPLPALWLLDNLDCFPIEMFNLANRVSR